MNYSDDNYQTPMGGMFAAQAAAGERSDFITKTYLHLAGAVGLFVVLEAVLLSLPGIDGLVKMMIGTSASSGVARMRRQTSKPSMPGIITSNRIKSGCRFSSIRSA